MQLGKKWGFKIEESLVLSVDKAFLFNKFSLNVVKLADCKRVGFILADVMHRQLRN